MIHTVKSSIVVKVCVEAVAAPTALDIETSLSECWGGPVTVDEIPSAPRMLWDEAMRTVMDFVEVGDTKFRKSVAKDIITALGFKKEAGE